jgi:hypothetical protein
MVQETAALRNFNPAYDRSGVKTGNALIETKISALPKTGHLRANDEYTP